MLKVIPPPPFFLLIRRDVAEGIYIRISQKGAACPP